MSDVIDAANERVELDLRLALQAHHRRQPAAGAPCTTCQDCEGAIEPKRLELLPFTRRCASCAHEFERGLR